MKGSTLAAPTFGPIRLDFCGLLGVLQCVVPFPFRSVCGGAVAVENVVVGLDGNSLGEGLTADATLACISPKVAKLRNLHSLVKLLAGDGSIALRLELVGRHV